MTTETELPACPAHGVRFVVPLEYPDAPLCKRLGVRLPGRAYSILWVSGCDECVRASQRCKNSAPPDQTEPTMEGLLTMALGIVDTIERLMLAARPVKQGSPTTVVSVVALALGSTTAEVRGGRRYKGAVRARHAAALALSKCGLNHPEIAKAIGVTDHTTAMSAVVSARARAEREPAFAAAVAEGVKAWGLPSGDEGRTVGV